MTKPRPLGRGFLGSNALLLLVVAALAALVLLAALTGLLILLAALAGFLLAAALLTAALARLLVLLAALVRILRAHEVSLCLRPSHGNRRRVATFRPRRFSEDFISGVF
jgi:hypothetical protein